MSPPWSKPLEVDRLADGGADVDFAVPLAELSGLRSPRADVAGHVTGSVRFAREAGVVVAELALRGVATLVCQRCMQPLDLAIEARVRIGLIGSQAQAAGLPPDLEPVLAPGGRISIGELITEELLLSLPIVPLHAAECAPLPAAVAAPELEMQTHKPFARLGELLKR
jgi:uncharacterized protein